MTGVSFYIINVLTGEKKTTTIAYFDSIGEFEKNLIQAKYKKLMQEFPFCRVFALFKQEDANDSFIT